jgi:hypothetical protein
MRCHMKTNKHIETSNKCRHFISYKVSTFLVSSCLRYPIYRDILFFCIYITNVIQVIYYKIYISLECSYVLLIYIMLVKLTIQKIYNIRVIFMI